MTTFTKSSITAEAARQLIEAGEAAAAERNLALVFAVCDDSGVLKAFSRMDGAALLAVQIAQDKAYTSAGFGFATDDWHNVIKDDEQLATGAVGGIDRLIAFAGGFPIKDGDNVIGGLGVSGGHHSEDREVALAALEAFGAAVA